MKGNSLTERISIQPRANSGCWDNRAEIEKIGNKESKAKGLLLEKENPLACEIRPADSTERATPASRPACGQTNAKPNHAV
jgi:hypothetical protein